MPRLTQIKETKKGRLALFFDGEFAFSLDENTFADAGLHQDDDLEEWKIEELRKKSETRRALDKGVKEVVFDRGGYVYHGRIAALADGAREAGLKF